MLGPVPLVGVQESQEVHTPYGIFLGSAFEAGRALVSLPNLMDAIMRLDRGASEGQPQPELRDDLAKLYCVCATLFCGAAVTVSPLELSLADLVRDVTGRVSQAESHAGDLSQMLEPLVRLVEESPWQALSVTAEVDSAAPDARA